MRAGDADHGNLVVHSTAPELLSIPGQDSPVKAARCRDWRCQRSRELAQKVRYAQRHAMAYLLACLLSSHAPVTHMTEMACAGVHLLIYLELAPVHG